MDKLPQNIPSLRPALAFTAGIFISANFSAPLLVIYPSCLLLFILLMLIHRFYSYFFERLFGALIFILFMTLGAAFFIRYNKLPYFSERPGQFSAVVLETPEEKPNSWKCLLQVNTFFRNDSTFRTSEKVLAYFEKTNLAQQLHPGSVILFNQSPQMVANSGNPFEFDYKKYLAGKRIYRQVYLGSDNWKATDLKENSLPTVAERTRHKLLSIYRDQRLGENETEILSALTLGYKSGLDPETKRIFSSAGAMHILAVSGLHVGIIFMAFSIFFGFLKKDKRGKYLFLGLSVVLLWGYALLTGLSPSVLRATIMVTLVSISQNLNRQHNIYNTLTVSAFILLIVNPNNLFDVGFQLSYSAVFGIVFFQPRFAKLWSPPHRILKYIWDLLTVSLAAQIATFPFTAFYFHQFPVYFLLTNLVIIPAAFLLIGLGIGLLAFSFVPGLSQLLAFLTKWSVKGTFCLLSEIESLPHSVQEINLLPGEFIALALAFLFTFIFIEHYSVKHLKLAMFAAISVFVFGILSDLKQQKSKEIIVFNQNENLMIELISGKQNYVISDRPVSPLDYGFRSGEAVRQNKRLNKPTSLLFENDYEDKQLFLKNGLLMFGGKLIFRQSKYENPFTGLTPDFFITNHISTIDGENKQLQPAKIIVVGKTFQKNKSNRAYYVNEQGAFNEKWK